jgi:hypothetical protein
LKIDAKAVNKNYPKFVKSLLESLDIDQSYLISRIPENQDKIGYKRGNDGEIKK